MSRKTLRDAVLTTLGGMPPRPCYKVGNTVVASPSDRDWSIFVAYMGDSKSFSEIGKGFGLSRSTVRRRVISVAASALIEAMVSSGAE